MSRFTSLSKTRPRTLALVLAVSMGVISTGWISSASAAPESPSVAAAPTVTATTPADGAQQIPTSSNSSNNIITATSVSATFDQAIDPATIESSPATAQPTFTVVTTAGENVAGTVGLSADGTIATFQPQASALEARTTYTASVSTSATSTSGVALAAPVTWSFTTTDVIFTAQAPVQLGSDGTFAILSKTGVTDVYASTINGNVGASPITGAAIHLTCPEVATGTMYTVDAAGPACAVTAPSYLTTAVSDMNIAYNDAAGRNFPDHINLGAGEIGGLTLTPGLYKWTSNVSISTDVTLTGGPDDVFIMQIAGGIQQASGKAVTLAGGVQAKNVFWQSAGSVAIGTTAHFEGTILGKTMIAMKTGATANGRLLAQTAVTLQKNAVTLPAE